MVRFENVEIRYRGKEAILTDVSFDLGDGNFHFLTGKSGATLSMKFSNTTCIIDLVCSVFTQRFQTCPGLQITPRTPKSNRRNTCFSACFP